MHHDEQIAALKPAMQRKMAMLVLAGWTFTYRDEAWVIRAPYGEYTRVWLTLWVGIEQAWRQFQLEEQSNG